MNKGNKYVYLSIFFVLLSIVCNAYNPLLDKLFGSITSIILFTGLVNSVLLILSIIFIDMALKRRDYLSSGIYKLARLWPFVILVMIIIHMVSILILFGMI